MSKSVLMDRVYDIFAEQTRKQARLYSVDGNRKPIRKAEPKRAAQEAHKKATKLLQKA